MEPKNNLAFNHLTDLGFIESVGCHIFECDIIVDTKENIQSSFSKSFPDFKFRGLQFLHGDRCDKMFIYCNSLSMSNPITMQSFKDRILSFIDESDKDEYNELKILWNLLEQSTSLSVLQLNCKHY